MDYATESNGGGRRRRTEPLSADAFQAETGLSDSTLEKLRVYLAELMRWQPKINLVGPATLKDPWRRHFLDSAQLMALVPAVPKGPEDKTSAEQPWVATLGKLALEQFAVRVRDLALTTPSPTRSRKSA